MEQVESYNVRDDSAQEITAEELMNNSQSDTVGAAEGAPEAVQTYADGTQSEETIANQTDFNKVLGKRLHAERSKYESSDEYKLGKSLIDARARKDNVSREEAIKRIRDDEINEKAARYAKNPQDFYRDYLTRDSEPQKPEPQENVSPQALANMLIEAGAADLGLKEITPQIAQDTIEHGAHYALLQWLRTQKEQTVAKVPKTIRSVSQAPAFAANDYENMSSADFKKLEERLRQATLNGQRVKL